MMPRLLAALGVPLRILCAVSLVLAAFAHRVPAASAFDGADLAAFVLPDGTIPLICRSGTSGDAPAGKTTGSCDFCRIASGVALPAPPALPDRLDIVIIDRSPASNDSGIPDFGPQLSSPPRGPPSLFT